ncbi:MAG: hypothetical protein K0S71_135 [Clostridia bacterium]|jgi:hypothetical protein|nr:hypothetical protein [Clostridia bacterium]
MQISICARGACTNSLVRNITLMEKVKDKGQRLWYSEKISDLIPEELKGTLPSIEELEESL